MAERAPEKREVTGSTPVPTTTEAQFKLLMERWRRASTRSASKEIMARLGHASARAAMIYQHATEDRDRLIADRLSEMALDAGLAPVMRLAGARAAATTLS